MSKPDKPGELRDVEVDAISLVPKAANGEKFKIFKSEAEGQTQEQAPEVIENNEQGLFHILKEFFTGKKIEKGAVADIVNSNRNGEKLYEAFQALMKVLGISRWSDESQNPETDPVKITAAVDDFRDLALGILLSKAEIEKAGRKISGSRLTKLKDIQTMLNDILDGLEENKEETELTKEEITKAVEDALKPIAERIEKMEAEPKQPTAPAESEQNKNIDVAEIVKNSVNEAIVPLTERIEKIEKARGFSNRVPEETQIEKDGNDFWGQIF